MTYCDDDAYDTSYDIHHMMPYDSPFAFASGDSTPDPPERWQDCHCSLHVKESSLCPLGTNTPLSSLFHENRKIQKI